jgi:plastocyanin
MPLPARTLITAAVALATTGLGCNGGPAPASPTAQPATPASSAAPLSGPRIVGTVTWTPETARKGVGVVYLEDAPKQPGAAMTASIDIKNKEFSPFIAVMTSGGTATFGNRDALTHHMFSPDVPGWDTGYLQKNDTVTRKFDSPGAFALLCNIHPEMLGYLLVIPSTYFGKFGPDGKYAIGNVPPGTYKATAWSPRTPPVSQSVTVGQGAATANFQLQSASSAN